MKTISVSRILLLLAGLFILQLSARAQTKSIITLDAKKARFKEIGKLPKPLKEASGLQITEGRYLWSHNDDGVPALYCMDTTGRLIKTIQLNHANRGWEDLALDDQGTLYVGGFGNNQNNKKDLRLYQLKGFSAIDKQLVQADILNFTYEDQKAFPPPLTQRNFDADAMIAWDGAVYIFTKNRAVPFNGYSKVYKLSPDQPEQKAVLVDSVFMGMGPMLHYWVTGADISPDKSTLALLFHDHVLFVKNFKKDKFSSGNFYQLNLDHYSHKAGISFMTNDKLYLVDELEMNVIGGKLYSLDISALRKDIK